MRDGPVHAGGDVRHPAGALRVERAGNQSPLYFTIKRGSVPQPSIRNTFMVRPGVGYIGLTGGFTQTTADELAASLDELSRQGMQNPSGVPGKFAATSGDARWLLPLRMIASNSPAILRGAKAKR